MSQKQTTHHPTNPFFTPHHVYVQRIDNNLSLDPTGFLANDVAQAHAHCVRLGYNPMPGEPSVGIRPNRAAPQGERQRPLTGHCRGPASSCASSARQR